jgi:D-methionine transport system substrate-binding protein
MLKSIFVSLFVISLLFLCGCHTNPTKIKVAATPMPHAEILENIKEDLKKEGITLVIVEVDDYALANRLLAEQVVDANFFQHIPYLKAEKESFGYNINWIAKVHLEPLAIYSSKISSLSQLPDYAKVGVPSDPSNETRALRLLEQQGLITLPHKSDRQYLTRLDIEKNPKKLQIEELDAAMLPRTLKDVDIAVVPGNYALQGKLDIDQALAIESKDSPYANVLVIRSGDEHRKELEELAKLLNSEKTRTFIKEKYHGRIIPAF